MQSMKFRFVIAAFVAILLAQGSEIAHANSCKAQCKQQVKICKSKCVDKRAGVGTLKLCKSKCDQEKKACFKTCG